jgi:putative membrane protein insertion efficiency factor
MKAIMVWVIKAYRLLLSPWLDGACRFYPTCSAYALQALEGHGLIKGGCLSMHRFCRSQPFCQGGHDPVPEPRHDVIKPLFSFTEPPKKNHP